MGEVLKRYKGGKFLGYYVRYYENGKRKVLATKQATHAEARRMLQAIEGRIARGLAGLDEPAPPAPILQELADRFLIEYSRPKMHDLADYRRHARSALLRVLPLLGKRPADGIRSLDIAKARDELGQHYAAASVRLSLTFLRAVFSWAIKIGVLTGQNPCRGVEMPKGRELLEYLSQEEASQLLSYAQEHAPDLYPMIAMALLTGLRKGELFGLRWRDIDFKGRRIDVERSYCNVTKGGTARHLRLPAALEPILVDWRKRCPSTPEALVFPVVRRGGIINMGREQDMLELPKLIAAAGCPSLERAWHALRHTFASHFVMSGGSILALQKILGHSDIKMTIVYAHLAPDYLGTEMDRVRFGVSKH